MRSDAVFILCITLLCVMFAGTPDLMDGLITFLSK
jgi:hypothetical protein